MMERFRLRVLDQPKRGMIWELKMFPEMPGVGFREKNGRVMGSSSAPATILWLRRLSDPYLKRSRDPGPIEGEKFGPKSAPRWLEWDDGLRLSLAFANARYLASPRQRKLFQEGLYDLPSEVILYWFTLCFYGYRQAAGKAALRTLLTYTGEEDAGKRRSRKQAKRKRTAPYPIAPEKKAALNVRELAEYLGGKEIGTA